MKKIFTSALLLICMITFGQNNKKLDRIMALRVAYISNKLELSAAEAEKFWPVFNAFDNKQMELRMQKRAMNFKLDGDKKTTLSEKELSKLFDDSEKIEDEIQMNRKSFIKNLQGIISTQKIMMLKQLEEDFKREMLNKIQDRPRRPRN